MVDVNMLRQALAMQQGQPRTACQDRRRSLRASYRSLVLTFICSSLILAFALGLHPGLARSATMLSAPNGLAAAPGPRGGEQITVAGHGADGDQASMDQTVLLDLYPSSTAVSVDQIFAVDVRIVAGTQPVDGAEIHIDFDPAHLRVVDAQGNPATEIEPGTALDVILITEGQVDNAQGHINYAAGTFSGSPPSGTFVLATVRFKALANTGGLATPLTFVARGGSPTDVVYQTASVLAGSSGGSVTIGGAAGTLEDPLPLLCGATEVGSTDGHAAMISEYGDCGGGFSGPEVVYALQLGQTQSVSITLNTSAPLALVALASPDASDCWYVGGSLPPETLPPATYYFVVDGFDSGDFTLQVDCQASTQDTPTPTATKTATATPSPTGAVTPSPTSPAWPGTYENPLPIFCDQTVTGSTSGYEAQFSAYGSCGSGFDLPEVWYRLQVQREADVYITVESSLSLYAFLLSSQDPEACIDSGSVVTIVGTDPETYYVVIDGTEFGRYNLDIRCEQPATLTATPSATRTGVPGTYHAFLPIVLKNWTVEPATPTHTISPSPTSELTWTPTAEPSPSPTLIATPTPAGTFQDPIPVDCEELRVGNSSGYSATTDSYGLCGSGFVGPEVVYQLQIGNWIDRLSVNFGAAVELRLLLLSESVPSACLASARPGSYVQLPNPAPGTYFIVVDGPTGGSYAFTAHCQPDSTEISGILSEQHAGQPRRYSSGFHHLPLSP